MVEKDSEDNRMSLGSTAVVIPSILSRADRLEREASALLKRHYASRAPEQLLQFVLAAADRITEELESLVRQEEAQQTLTPEEFDVVVRRKSQLLIPLHQIMSFLDRSQVEETAADLVPSLRRLISDTGLVDDLDLILQPTWNVNYQVLDIRRRIQKSMDSGYSDLVDRLPSHLVLLQFPKTEINNALLHSVVAHELGHHVYQSSNAADQLLGKIQLSQPPLSEMIDELVSERMKRFAQGFLAPPPEAPTQLTLWDALRREQFEASINRDLTVALSSWVEELACDALATELVGISYFFAFADFAMSLQGLDDCAPTHPPARLRMRLMRSMLTPDMDGLRKDRDATLSATDHDYFAGLEAHFVVWCQPIDAPEQPQTGPVDILRIARTAVDSILPDISEIAKGRVARQRNRCFDREIDKLCNQLRLLITCNEIMDSDGDASRAADVDQIMRAAWAFAMAGFPGWKEQYRYDASGCMTKMSELVLKSIQLVEVTKTLKGA